MPRKRASISHTRTLGAIENIKYKRQAGLDILLKPTADALSIIKDIELGVFVGKRKLIKERIETLLVKAKQPISTVTEIANKGGIIFISTKIDLPAGAVAVLSYRDKEGREFTVKFEL